jgi:lactoylglutathione lyase
VTVRAVGVNHIGLEVDDLDAAMEWYARFFEFDVRGRRGGMAWLDLGDQFLALSVREGATSEAAEVDRGRHIGLVVADKEAVRDELRAAGYAVGEPGTRFLRVHDPSGNQLEIVDYRDVQFSKTDAVLRGMGLQGLEKSDTARAELRDKGMGT